VSLRFILIVEQLDHLAFLIFDEGEQIVLALRRQDFELATFGLLDIARPISRARFLRH
jgi:hypothetical protein